MSWAFKRQILVLTVMAVLFSLFVFFVVVPYFYKTPTCTDNKQNGDEVGVDCGGSCTLACTFEADRVSVLWSRSFQVVEERYNAVAYVENKNRNKAVEKINYKFRFADKDNIYIGIREGSTTIPPAGKFAIFEPAVDVGNSIPVYTTFEFTEEPIWVNVPEEKISQLKITISSIKLEDESFSPRLSANLKNNSLFDINEVGVVAILYDAVGNALSVSRTYLDILQAEEAETVNFTWPEPFPRPIVAKEIIPIYNIFSTQLK
ncbi:MAG: hypothetical protein Q8O46_05350 [bacterium]|nr:hypothetical protein [bacterium]